jgi:hypothetical protein
LLWRRRRNGDGSLTPAKALHRELLNGHAKSQFSNDLKVPAVKKSLRALKAAGMVDFGQSTRTDRMPGPTPNGYRISADPPIITWTTSAALVVVLHNHRDRRLKRETLIAEAVRLGVTHHNSDKRLEPGQISDLIDWCVRKGYFLEKEVLIEDGAIPTNEMLLTTTAKVDECELFLRKIADEVKHLAVTDRPQSEAGEGGLENLS